MFHRYVAAVVAVVFAVACQDPEGPGPVDADDARDSVDTSEVGDSESDSDAELDASDAVESDGRDASDVDADGREAGSDDAEPAPDVMPTCGDGVVEGDEHCDDANAVDDDGCTSQCTFSPGTFAWSRVIDGAEFDEVHALGFGPDASLWVTGMFTGGTDLGGQVFPASESRRVFLASYAPSGDHRSSRVYGPADDNQHVSVGDALAFSDRGDVFLGGYFAPSIDFGSGERRNGDLAPDAFVLALDPAGNHAWDNRWGERRTDRAYSLAVDSAGHIYGVGSDELDGSFARVVAHIGSWDTTSLVRWTDTIDSSDGAFTESTAHGVAVDSQDRLAVTGWFSRTADFGDEERTSTGAKDVFLAQYDSSGAPQWSVTFGGAGADQGRAVAIDDADNVYVAGQFQGAMTVDGQRFEAVWGYDVFVSKFDSSGQHVWTETFGSSTLDSLYDLVVHDSGVAFVGSFSGRMDVGTETLNAGGNTHGFAISLTQDGAIEWSRSFGGTTTARDGARLNAIASRGSLFAVGGTFVRYIDLGGATIEAVSESDGFVAVFVP